MTTRSRTRSGVSRVPYTAPAPKPQTKSKNRNLKTQHDVDISSELEGKEVKEKTVKISNVKPRKTKKPLKSILCFCSKDDDGSPMILCSECKIWYVYHQLNFILTSVHQNKTSGTTSLVLISVSQRQRKLVSIDLISSPSKFSSDPFFIRCLCLPYLY